MPTSLDGRQFVAPTTTLGAMCGARRYIPVLTPAVRRVKIPLALLAPVLIGLVPVLAGVTAQANPFVALLVCIGLAAGIEAVGLWWWTRRDPLRLSEEDKTEIGVAVTALPDVDLSGRSAHPFPVGVGGIGTHRRDPQFLSGKARIST